MGTLTKPLSRIKWETVRKRYGKRMQAVMQRVYDSLKASYPEMKAEAPFEMDADMYSVNMMLRPDGMLPISLDFEIVESVDYEGIEGGYTFRLNIVAQGGLVIGGMSPYNYTDECWCVSLATIEERFRIFEIGIDASDIATTIMSESNILI